MTTDWKRERNERARRELFRKITDPATNRMRTRTAKQQLAAELASLRGPDEIPDADDSSVAKRYD